MAASDEARLRMVVAESVAAAEGVVTLTLASREAEELPAWEPGAHIDLLLDDDGGQLVRPYSLCGEPADRARFQVAVLLEPAGRGGSRFVHERLTPGDVVEVRGPRNNFPLVDAVQYRIVAGGSESLRSFRWFDDSLRWARTGRCSTEGAPGRRCRSWSRSDRLVLDL